MKKEPHIGCSFDPRFQWNDPLPFKVIEGFTHTKVEKGSGVSILVDIVIWPFQTVVFPEHFQGNILVV
jgi:hypothetical protein